MACMARKTSTADSKIEHKVGKQVDTILANTIIRDRRYLDDEQLDRETQFRVLGSIFDANVRDREIREVAAHFAPILRGGHPMHMACLGKTGVGKTVSMLYLLRLIQKMCRNKGIELQYKHINLSTPRPCFRAINDIACLLNASKRYRKGISLEELMGRIEDSLASYSGYLVLLIDEVDNVRTDIDTFTRFLVRRLPQSFPGKLILVFISNRLEWANALDPRVKSFLKMNELVFDAYDATDLKSILSIRVRKALDRKMIEPGVVEKIAACASQNHGDARKAVELLARSAYMAEKNGTTITLETVDQANEEIERDKYVALIKTSPKQLQAALYAVLSKLTERPLSTGEAYDRYRAFCEAAGLRDLTHRAFSDLIGELDLSGFVWCRVKSKGRYGRTREIRPTVPEDIREDLLRIILFNFDIPQSEVRACTQSQLPASHV